MRILLVQPAPFEDRRLGLENTVWMSEPVALTSIAAMVPEHEVPILDLRCEDARALPDTLASFRPDLVGTTAMTTDAYQAKAVLRLSRQVCPGALTIIGGHHATLLASCFHESYVDLIVQGEGEVAFQEIVAAWSERRDEGLAALLGIDGVSLRKDDGTFTPTSKRAWVSDLDSLPAPARHLVEQYRGQYFFLAARPMASLFTSRGCSFDCNFCAIWEFYDRRTRFVSAEVIADRMEACPEPFIFLLDDNFLTRTDRLERLADELERRKIKKYWMSQGRADFVAKNPALIARLAKVGLTGILSGYESNAEDALAALRKRSTLEVNVKAARILRDNGVISTGIFMVRPEFEPADFKALYEYIIEVGVAIPLVTILTPLPGTELYRERESELLTHDFRLFDLLHAVLPTKLPRERFYQEYVKWRAVGRTSRQNWFTARRILARQDFYRALLPGVPRMVWNRLLYEPIQFDWRSYLRDEAGIIEPGAILPAGDPLSQAAK